MLKKALNIIVLPSLSARSSGFKLNSGSSSSGFHLPQQKQQQQQKQHLNLHSETMLQKWLSVYQDKRICTFVETLILNILVNQLYLRFVRYFYTIAV